MSIHSIEIIKTFDREFPWACVVIAPWFNKDHQKNTVLETGGELSIWCHDALLLDNWLMEEDIITVQIDGWTILQRKRSWWFKKQEDAVAFQIAWCNYGN